MAQKTNTRALTRWENEGGEIETAASKSKPSATPTRPRGSNTGKKSSTPATPSPVGSLQQLRAQTAVKRSRQKEAGLLSRRIGKASASTQRAQGKRDSKH